MASTYSTRLRLELMGSGDQSGTWGTTTNTNLGTLLEASIAGRAAVSMTDADYTLTVANGSADEARNMILNISGALTATRNVICPAVSKLYVVKNATTGGQSIILKTSAGTGVTIGPGLTSLVLCDGTNVVEGINSVSNLTFSSSAARIQGDFSNATLANRTAFQDKTTNAVTGVIVLPNGTATQAVHTVFNNSNPTNSGYFGIGISSTLATLTSANTGSGTAVPMVFAVGAGAPEVARFDTAGVFYVGMTTTVGSGCAFEKLANGGRLFVGRTNADTVAEWNFNGVRVGSVSIGSSSTAYNTTSDYRLKENVQPMTGALAKVQALNPVTYTWKFSGEQGQGFIAHELQAVIPTAVTGEKDSVYENGEPRYQGVDASYVVATLVAAVKELSARVAALEAK